MKGIKVIMEKKLAIQVSDLTKIYRLYDKPMDRLKESLGLVKIKKYKEHFALKDVNIDIYRGETVGIIGTNGSGKSTILKIITGVLTATSGNLIVDGRISALLELGAGFNMEYTGIENIYLNGVMIGFSEDEITEKLDEILDFADIGEFVNQPVKTYSSGMFVRLAFAVAINIEPEILIVDEALSVGDVFFQAKCYHKFEEFKKLGKTILFVSHDLSSISKYCDRVVLLNKGTKLAEGTPKEVINIYKQVLVGQYELPSSQEEIGLLEDPDIIAKSNPDKKGKTISNDNNESKDQDSITTDKATAHNPTHLEYGNKKAEIIEYSITDNKGIESSSILKGEDFTVSMKVKVLETLEAPIFAFSIKDVMGIEITGTNTMVEKAFIGSAESEEVKLITFTQKMTLQGGEYLLSLGVTGYEGSNFTVYHRLYDVINITVISDKNTVGMYDMYSKVEVCNSK